MFVSVYLVLLFLLIVLCFFFAICVKGADGLDLLGRDGTDQSHLISPPSRGKQQQRVL